MKKVLVSIALGLSLALAGGLIANGDPMNPISAKPSSAKAHKVKAARAVAKESWTCSMHPEIHKAHPGHCPKCGMDLIKEKKK